MTKKNNDSIKGTQQLSFPFNFHHQNKPEPLNNVVCFLSKRIQNIRKEKTEKGIESINRLLKHAEKLNW